MGYAKQTKRITITKRKVGNANGTTKKRVRKSKRA